MKLIGAMRNPLSRIVSSAGVMDAELLQISEELKKDLRGFNDIHVETAIAGAKLFFGAKGDPWQLVRHAFWPVPFLNTTAFGPDAAAALVAEPCGLCAILRRYQQASDAIYMHPAALAAVARLLGDGHRAQKALIQRLCESLREIPAGSAGKLFERTRTRAATRR